VTDCVVTGTGDWLTVVWVMIIIMVWVMVVRKVTVVGGWASGEGGNPHPDFGCWVRWSSWGWWSWKLAQKPSSLCYGCWRRCWLRLWQMLWCQRPQPPLECQLQPAAQQVPLPAAQPKFQRRPTFPARDVQGRTRHQSPVAAA
jgi:hypothetical protein